MTVAAQLSRAKPPNHDETAVTLDRARDILIAALYSLEKCEGFTEDELQQVSTPTETFIAA